MVSKGNPKKRFQVNIWFLEKWRSYPRVTYYEAETKQQVMGIINKEFPKYNDLLIMEIPNHNYKIKTPERE
jgi:hypothetical protein